jgi:hypothetical protein
MRTKLTDLPNIGKAIAADLLAIGISSIWFKHPQRHCPEVARDQDHTTRINGLLLIFLGG